MTSKKYIGNQNRIAKQKQEFLEQLKTIPILQVVCERLDIARATFYRWKTEDSEFSLQVEEAISNGDLLVNDLAESQVINLIKNGNLPASSLWLRTHHKKYGNKLEVTGSLNTESPLTEDQKLIIKNILMGNNNKNQE